MKPATTLLLTLAISLGSIGQNWSPIPQQHGALYRPDAVISADHPTIYASDSSWLSLTIDSVFVVGADTVFVPKKIVGKTIQNPYGPGAWDTICADVYHWIGRSVIKHADGWYSSVNRGHDTLRLPHPYSTSDTLLAIGDTAWLWHRDSFSVQGTDSIAHFSFSAWADSTSIHDSVWDGVTIALSKQFGFIKSSFWYLMPHTATTLSAANIHRNGHISYAERNDYLDWELGTRMETTVYYNTGSNSFGTGGWKYTLQTWLRSKCVVIDMDSSSPGVNRYSLDCEREFTEKTYRDTLWTSYISSIDVTTSRETVDVFSEPFPLSQLADTSGYFMLDDGEQILLGQEYARNMRPSGTPDCPFKEVAFYFEPNYGEGSEYILGIGKRSGYHYTAYWGTGGVSVVSTDFTLNYLLSPHHTYGVEGPPIGVKEVVSNASSIFPNPSSGIIQIASDGAIEEVIVTDLSGKVVQRLSMSPALRQTADLSHLGSGIYLLQLMHSNGKMEPHRVVIQAY